MKKILRKELGSQTVISIPTFEEYPDILTVKQLCEMLNIGKNLAYDLLGSGAIKSIKIGAIYRVPKVWVLDYLRCANNLSSMI
jgi:excisionase family DNA binding protein